MLKTILLLNPVYVTLFWAIVLMVEYWRTGNTLHSFLGQFMWIAWVVYVSHFLYFSSFMEVYAVVDPFYQFASLLVYPMFYIYVRLLTVDKKYSYRQHGVYLLAPTLLFLLYTAGILWTTSESLYQRVVLLMIKVISAMQVIGYVLAGISLIYRYGDKAKSYYSNMEDARVNKIYILSILMFVLGTISSVIGILGRDAYVGNIYAISFISVVYSTALFIIGWLGMKQRHINPTFELHSPEIAKISVEEKPVATKARKNLAEAFSIAMNEKKLYLNSSLTIRDLAQAIGSNRTEVSAFINAEYGQNFCSYINTYRVEALKQALKERPKESTSLLAESCGFGSVDSMKRAVLSKTGMTFQVWKASVLNLE